MITKHELIRGTKQELRDYIFDSLKLKSAPIIPVDEAHIGKYEILSINENDVYEPFEVETQLNQIESFGVVLYKKITQIEKDEVFGCAEGMTINVELDVMYVLVAD
jgi:hypothetical protein